MKRTHVWVVILLLLWTPLSGAWAEDATSAPVAVHYTPPQRGRTLVAATLADARRLVKLDDVHVVLNGVNEFDDGVGVEVTGSNVTLEFGDGAILRYGGPTKSPDGKNLYCTGVILRGTDNVLVGLNFEDASRGGRITPIAARGRQAVVYRCTTARDSYRFLDIRGVDGLRVIDCDVPKVRDYAIYITREGRAPSRNIRIEGGRFGGTDDSGHALRAYYVENLVLDRVTIDNSGGRSVFKIHCGDGVLVTRCTLRGTMNLGPQNDDDPDMPPLVGAKLIDNDIDLWCDRASYRHNAITLEAGVRDVLIERNRIRTTVGPRRPHRRLRRAAPVVRVADGDHPRQRDHRREGGDRRPPIVGPREPHDRGQRPRLPRRLDGPRPHDLRAIAMRHGTPCEVARRDRPPTL